MGLIRSSLLAWRKQDSVGGIDLSLMSSRPFFVDSGGLPQDHGFANWAAFFFGLTFYAQGAEFSALLESQPTRIVSFLVT